jgi:hypothetical protein
VLLKAATSSVEPTVPKEVALANRRKFMSNQGFQAGSPKGTRSEGVTDRTTRTAKEALSSASTLAGEAADQVKEAASQTASTLTGEVKEVLDRKVSGGADTLGVIARSAKRVADDLDRDAPQMAGMVRALASRMDGYADDLRHQSVDELVRTASDFTRRQPAVVFGLAALAGFFALRTLKSGPSTAATLKSGPSTSAPPIQPSHSNYSGGARDFYGP